MPDKHGLYPLALASLTRQEKEALDTRAPLVVLLGNVGPSIWTAFSGSPESSLDVNPLDAWSKRVIGKKADAYGATCCFPSDGPPFAPFQQWAFRSNMYHPSPIGLAIHRDYGLWTAFRGALLLDKVPADLVPGELQDPGGGTDHCATCVDKPCLTTCPVGAFSADSYNVADCRRYVGDGKNPCLADGCLARRACPVRPDLAYDRQQVAFHMGAFVSSKQE